ncbi:NHL repeat-containing protein [candidate division FCPU426 bacterium]|nr:NHL repeat-containing protein [candidate division FCPU426 bacterium]
MKMTRKQFLQTLLAGSLAAVAGKITGCKNAKPVPPAENPYAYDISQFKKVPPTRITHQELDPIPFQNDPPKCLALTADNTLLVAAGQNLYLYDSLLKKRSFFSLPQEPQSIAALSADAIHVAYRDSIQVYTGRGKLLRTWSPLGESAFITGLAVGENHVVAADYGNKRLWLFDRQGNLKRFIGIKSGHRHAAGFQIPSPYFDVHFGRDNSIWVVNSGLHRLENYALNGTLKSFWGKPGMALEGFSGCCNPTYFAILRNGDFVTVEKGLVRIKTYSPTGSFTGVVAPPDAFQDGLTGVDLAADSAGRIYAVDRFKKQVRIFVEK